MTQAAPTSTNHLRRSFAGSVHVRVTNILYSLFFAAATTTACVQAYRAPNPPEPRVAIQFSRRYENAAGTSLREILEVEGGRAFDRTIEARNAEKPAQDVVYVHARRAKLTIAVAFGHSENRTVSEQYPASERETYSESYSCGTYTSRQTCTRTATRTRFVYKHRTVTKAVWVNDAACRVELNLMPVAGRRYALDLVFRDNEKCMLACTEHYSSSDGTPAARACGP